MAEVRVAWFHCASGVAGDMALGSLLDAGADVAEVTALVRRLDVDGWELEAEPVLRCGVAATKAHVHLDRDEHHHRTWKDIRALLDGAGLPDRVAERATAVFSVLAEAEGALHRTHPDDVHFHEVGAVDAIVDVVGTCAALEVLGVDVVRCSPISVGRGTVQAAHGTLPNPAPAVVRVLAAVGAPVHGIDTPVELTTPTGAALVAGLVGAADGFGPLPDVRLEATGFGAGSADPDGVVNATQVVLGAVPVETGAAGAFGTTGAGQQVVVLEANVDDATGEVLADAVAALLAEGALDAWVTSIVMKKGRPGHVVAALADPVHAGGVADVLRRATGTLGVRASTRERWPARRSMAEVEVDGHVVRVKVSASRVKAEHDDVLAVAAATGRPPLEVAARAEAAWWSSVS